MTNMHTTLAESFSTKPKVKCGLHDLGGLVHDYKKTKLYPNMYIDYTHPLNIENIPFFHFLFVSPSFLFGGLERIIGTM
jgi:hypothetical protein